ncbi:MAG: hypothetical protein ACE5PV_21220 [Candidatus Poribacteria bacterium]
MRKVFLLLLLISFCLSSIANAQTNKTNIKINDDWFMKYITNLDSKIDKLSAKIDKMDEKISKNTEKIHEVEVKLHEVEVKLIEKINNMIWGFVALFVVGVGVPVGLHFLNNRKESSDKKKIQELAERIAELEKALSAK